jgi:hypothetical protein
MIRKMYGLISAGDASVPPGAAAPAGQYLSLVVDAKTFQVLDFGLGPKPPPVSPASLGPVTHLTVRPETAASRHYMLLRVFDHLVIRAADRRGRLGGAAPRVTHTDLADLRASAGGGPPALLPMSGRANYY